MINLSVGPKTVDNTCLIYRHILMDKPRAYIDGIERVFDADTVHVQSEGMASLSHNNFIERFHVTLKQCTKVMRGLRSPTTASLVLAGWRRVRLVALPVSDAILVRGDPMKLKVVLELSDEGGYTVYAPSLPGCISEGDTKEEALANIRQAIKLYLEPTEDARPADA